MFNKDLIDLILAGKKTMTSRDKRQFRVGDTTNLMANKDYSKITGKCIKFTCVYSQTLKEYTEADAHKEGFQSLDHFKKYWIKNIGGWKDDIQVYVHEFEVVEYIPSMFEKHHCDQCGSCCIQLRSIINIPRSDIVKWVRGCRADILQYCDGWYDELEDVLILNENQKQTIDYFMDSLNMEMWFDPRTGDETPICPFLDVDIHAKKFQCLVQDMKPSICRKYRYNPSKMLSIVKKPFEENLKEYRKERRHYHSVKSAPHKLETPDAEA